MGRGFASEEIMAVPVLVEETVGVVVEQRQRLGVGSFQEFKAISVQTTGTSKAFGLFRCKPKTA